MIVENPRVRLVRLVEVPSGFFGSGGAVTQRRLDGGGAGSLSVVVVSGSRSFGGRRECTGLAGGTCCLLAGPREP